MTRESLVITFNCLFLFVYLISHHFSFTDIWRVSFLQLKNICFWMYCQTAITMCKKRPNVWSKWVMWVEVYIHTTIPMYFTFLHKCFSNSKGKTNLFLFFLPCTLSLNVHHLFLFQVKRDTPSKYLSNVFISRVWSTGRKSHVWGKKNVFTSEFRYFKSLGIERN